MLTLGTVRKTKPSAEENPSDNTNPVVCMATQNEVRAVHARHPSAEVLGSGSYGAITECREVVRVALFNSESAATNAASGKCSARAGCTRKGHRVEVFTPAPIKPTIRFGQMDADDRRYEREQRRMQKGFTK